jgi:hypothetical protein
MLPETTHALGMALSVRSIRPRKQITPAMPPALPRRCAIAPLEQFDMPQALSRVLGTNCGERSSLDARTDRGAVNAWLPFRKSGNHTLRAYRKEAERFLLWSVFECGEVLSSLAAEDGVAYRDFVWRIGGEAEDKWRQSFRAGK